MSKLLQYVNQDDDRQHSLVNADHVVDNVDARVDIDYVNRFPKWDWHYAEIISGVAAVLMRGTSWNLPDVDLP